MKNDHLSALAGSYNVSLQLFTKSAEASTSRPMAGPGSSGALPFPAGKSSCANVKPGLFLQNAIRRADNYATVLAFENIAFCSFSRIGNAGLALCRHAT
ncbi:hypothetical protein ACFOLJ_05870 [Rugamonas sp. CCM 8940]|uniref:hypothetical protein n=1 Tax=Rugamonas sp. CCM 8940 TaxID=2765359 RepID=UPI0018F4EEFA|nr:hypothetical protein [Rugamonas sp. CCM 8940]MBJ7312749.1 hypothetical protein [Rugamonas sp. CCM 8940]